MPSVTKSKHGYRVQVYVKGTRDSATFRTRREADAWGAARETELRVNSTKTPGEIKTLKQALEKYRDEEAPKKKDAIKEAQRVERLIRRLPVHLIFSEVNESHISAYRDQRLTEAKKNTVLRELGTLGGFFETARREWKWITRNPCTDIDKPRRPKHRDVVITRWQIKAMLRSFGYRKTYPSDMAQRAAYAFLIALRTGMRAGEVCSLIWSQFYGDYVHVSSKTEAGDRDVPLSKKARLIFNRLRGEGTLVVGIGVGTLDTYFRKHRDLVGLSGFTFHDSRHTAATWIGRAGRINVLDMCKMFGWTDPKMAMCYYNPTASDMAKLL